MKTLVVGGTGFLGSYIVDALLEASNHVTILSRTPEKSATQLPDGVATLRGDVDLLTIDQWVELLAPFDKLVYAAGVDERVRPTSSAQEFYDRANVEPCRRALLAARDTGITHVALLNSIFTHVNRERPELDLTSHHPYIASRVAQSEMALAVSDGYFVTTVLEVPWVFGDSRGKESQWAALVSYVRVALALTSPRGGTIAINAANVGKAVVGALTRPTRSSSLPIGDCHISWDDLLLRLSDLAGRPGRAVTRLPDRVFIGMTTLGAVAMRMVGEKAGLDYSRMHEFLLTDISADLDDSQQLLAYGDPDIDHALAATVSSVKENGLVRGWRNLAGGQLRKSARGVFPVADVA